MHTLGCRMWTSSTDGNTEYRVIGISYTSCSPTIYYDSLFNAYDDSSQYPPIAVTDGGGQSGSSHIKVQVPSVWLEGAGHDVKLVLALALHPTETHFPLAFNLSLPKIISSLLTGIVSLAWPLTTHSPYHHHLDHAFCVLTNNTAVRLKTRRAPNSIVGTLPRDLVTSTRSSLGSCVDPFGSLAIQSDC